METIWKYELEVKDNQCIEMPKHSQLLSVQMQNGKPCLWVKLNTEFATSHVEIKIYGTGNPIFDVGLTFIDSFQMEDGALVFHVFRKH